jgi:hypothetical protein
MIKRIDLLMRLLRLRRLRARRAETYLRACRSRHQAAKQDLEQARTVLERWRLAASELDDWQQGVSVELRVRWAAEVDARRIDIARSTVDADAHWSWCARQVDEQAAAEAAARAAWLREHSRCDLLQSRLALVTRRMEMIEEDSMFQDIADAATGVRSVGGSR